MSVALRRRGRPISLDAPIFAREIAGDERLRLVPTSFGEDPHPSKILRLSANRGLRIGELYQDMQDKDTDLAGLIEKRWRAVMGLPRRILPRDSSPRAIEMADFARLALAGIPNFHTNLAHQWQGISDGLAIDEILWQKPKSGPLQGRMVPVDIIDRPMWRFFFRDSRLFVRQRLGPAILAPPNKFLCFRHGTKDSPWGRALLDRAYWYYFLKRHAWKYYGVNIEKWAQPTTLGRYKHNREDENVNRALVESVLDALEEIQTGYAAAVPDDFEIQLLEATRGGTVSYESFIGLCNRAMALVFLGEVDTSGFARGPGSFAKSRVSNEVRLETIRIDAHELSTHLTDNLIRPLVVANFGATAPVPFWVFDVEEAEDRVLRQTGMAAVLDAGEPVPRDDFYRTHQVRPPREGEEVVTSATSEAVLEAAEPEAVDDFEELDEMAA